MTDKEFTTLQHMYGKLMTVKRDGDYELSIFQIGWARVGIKSGKLRKHDYMMPDPVNALGPRESQKT